MALKVWMPLHGNLRNLGASILPITNNGATVNANGKIGPCYQFNNTNITLSPTTEFNNSFSSEGTLALWIKLNSNHSGYALVLTYGLESTSWNGIVFGIDINGSGIPIFNCSDRNSYTNCSLGINIKDNSWHHLAATYQSNQLKIYLDGILKNTVTTTIIPDWASCSVIAIGGNNSEKLANNDCLNDIRIYNHCLSAMEVREIAKGLTLHYKLDLCDNLLLLLPRAYNPGIYQAYQLLLIENLQSGQTYTFLFWDVDVAHSAKAESGLGIAVYWGGGSVALKTMNGTSYFTNGHADYLEFTTTISSSLASGDGAANPWLCIYNSVGDATGTKYMHIGKWQVTKGSTIRPWTRTITSDIIDSSGYNNNASSNGTLRVGNSVSTPRYTCSAWFDTGARITTPVSAHTFLPTDAITVNIWCKTPDVSLRFLSCTEGGGWNFEVSGGVLTFPIYIESVGYQICSFTTTLSTMNDNQWHMYTATYDRSQIKVYFDGVLDNTLTVSTGNPIWYLTYTPLCLGTEGRSISDQVAGTFVGALSDLRIYSTALLDNDIQLLYNVSMKVGKNGVISVYELDEINGNKIASNNMYALSGATSSYDRATNTWTLTIPNNTNTDVWGLGLGLLSNTHDNRLYIPWNNSYRLTMEVYSPVALNLVMDYNNYAVDGSQTNGNDNDNIENRWLGSVPIPANTWTKVGFATRNSNSTYNPNKTFLYDDSTFGIKNTSGSSLTYKIRNIRWYLRNDTKKVYKTGVIKNNLYIERDKASFNNSEQCLEANEFIER